MTADVKSFPDIPAQQPRKLLGEIFVEKGLLTEISVQRLVDNAKSRKIRLGELLEAIGLITSEELADALATQYRCRRITDFAKYAIHAHALRIIPIDMAVKNTIFPLQLQNDKLGLAVADPTTEKLFEEISERHHVKIVLFVASRMEINRAIARHYMGQAIVEPVAKTILLIEDDMLMRESVSKVLVRNGYSVETAVDGMDAFNKIFTQRPRLGITDKVMPKLNGYEFLYAIRNIPEFRYIPVILMTAAATPDEEKEALEKGFFDFILKPIKELSLLTRVQRAFQSCDILYGKTG